MNLDVTIVTPDRTIWRGRATQVVVPSVDGSLGVLRGAQPVLAILKPGDVRVIGDDGVEVFAVEGGFMSMDRDVVTIGIDHMHESGAAAGSDRAAR